MKKKGKGADFYVLRPPFLQEVELAAGRVYKETGTWGRWDSDRGRRKPIGNEL